MTFLKYYWNNVIKKGYHWFSIIAFLYFIFTTGFDIKFENYPKIDKWDNVTVLIIGVILFLFSHIFHIYKLWKKEDEGIENSLPDIYEDILKKFRIIFPEEDIFELLKDAYKEKSKESGNLKEIIRKNFPAYRKIYNAIESLYKNKDNRLVISSESGEIKDKLDDNYKKLELYNINIGCSKGALPNCNKAINLINEINDNILTLFTYIN